MRVLSFLTIFVFLTICVSQNAYAIDGKNIEYSKNYLYILVHGIGDDHKCFDNVYDYMTKSAGNGGMGLEGYVNRYEFSDQFLNIEKEGWEFGDRRYDNPEAVSKKSNEINEIDDKESSDKRKSWQITKRENNGLSGTGKSWLEQAKEDFKIWFKKYGPGKAEDREPLASEIPSKFIVIAHSMGGLSVRSYIYGKDQTGKRYYQDDIEKVVYIDTPHLGSGAANLSRWASDYRAARWMVPLAFTAIGNMVGFWGTPFEKSVLAVCTAYSLAGTMSIDVALEKINRWKTPAIVDMVPNSSFLINLNSLNMGDGYNPLKKKIIIGRGVPSPKNISDGEAWFHNLFVYERIMASLLNAVCESELDTWEAKMLSIYLSSLSGYPFFEDGDFAVEAESQRAEGIKSLADAQRFEYLMRSDEFATYGTVANAALLSSFFLPPPLDFYIAVASVIPIIVSTIDNKDPGDYLMAHITMKDKVVINEGLLDKALFEETQPVGATSAFAVNQIPLKFSSNLTKEAGEIKVLNSYKEVSIEAVTEAKRQSGVPILLDGKEKYIESFMFKEPPTKIEGVLRDFMPLSMQYFQYSENFAAWKNVKVLDEWGRFEIDGLKLAEGQNVIAFKAKNKVGYNSNQIIKITVNSIPLLPSKFAPEPNIFISNNQPEFSVNFAKAAFSSSILENILLKLAKHIGPDGKEEDITKEVKVIISGGANNKEMLVTWKPKNPLPDGPHQIIVVAESNVGTAQAAWGINIDTTSPVITMNPIKAYSPRAPASAKASAGKPTTITYIASDEVSPLLASASCDLYKNDQFITNIATVASLSKGENFMTLDPKALATLISDGIYSVRIKAFDLAGNFAVAEQPIVIDSTPPVIQKAELNPQIMSSKFNEQTLTISASEKSIVFINMKNALNNSARTYIAQVGEEGKGIYTWVYNNSLMSPPEDGIYNIEIYGQDEAGNIGTPVTLESVRIDRIPPVVYSTSCLPYALSNSGKNPYTTTMSYSISNSSPSPLQGEGRKPVNKQVTTRQDEGLNRQDEGQVGVRVKLYNETTHELVKVWDPAPASLTEVNKVTWNANTLIPGPLGTLIPLPKGSYRFQIIAEDDLGNQSIAYASCVKDGIAPLISFPAEDNQEVSGTIAIRGTAIDPDWTNSKPFKQYRVYYQQGTTSIPGSLGALDPGVWKTDLIEVPEIHRDKGQVARNVGMRPLQNDSTLAYFYTNSLPNGTYTILVIAEEENGESASAVRVVNVNNKDISDVKKPYVQLFSLPDKVNFKDKDKDLTIAFQNSVKPANVHLEVLRPSLRSGEGGPRASEESRGVGEVVFYKYLSNLDGSPYIGKPAYKSGQDLGTFIWQDQDGWHIRWSSDGNNHHFTGSLIALGGNVTVNKTYGSGVKSFPSLVVWDANLSNEEGGIDFSVANAKQLMVIPKIDEDPASPQVYAEKVYQGVSKTTQTFLPITIDLASSSNSPYQQIKWDGKLDTGAFVDNGDYIVRLRAEGADGFGISTDEASIKIETPFECSNFEITEKEFNPLSLPDRVSAFFNVSKDSLLSAYVYDKQGKLISTLCEGKEILGTLNIRNKQSIVWRGNYPDANSGTVVNAGEYRLKIVVQAKDGSGKHEENLSNIKVSSFSYDSAIVKLDSLGEENLFNGKMERLAEGESPYYFEAKAKGLYYAPRDFSCTLLATGEQRATVYPYVPFAALAHRGFKQVDVLVKAKIKAKGYNHTLEMRIGFFNVQHWWEKRGGQDQYHDLTKGFAMRDGGGDYYLEDNSFTKGGIYSNGFSVDHAGLEGGEALIEIYSKDGSFLLDSCEAWVKDSDGFVKTDKGMFEVKIEGNLSEQNDAGHAGRYHAKVYVRMPQGSEIAYSRLTNRYVPWVGFVSKKHPTSKEFSSYFTDIQQGLGFPGNLFFNDPDAKLNTPYKSADEIVNEIQSGKDWKEKVQKMNEIAKAGSLKGYKETLASSVGYDSYLSDEYFEFIPITHPASKNFIEKSDTYWEAETDVTLFANPAPNQPLSSFLFTWPQADIGTWKKTYGLNGTNYNRLKNNPQEYDGWGGLANICYYDLDENELNSRPTGNQKIVNGKTLYNGEKCVWKSSQMLGELLPLPSFVENLQYAVINQDEKIKISLSGTSRNDYINAEDTNPPQDWTSADDKTLEKGIIRSSLKVFNEKIFRGSEKRKFFEDYRVSADYSSSDALKYTFLEKDPFNRTADIKIDNPNLKITHWEAVLFDKSGSENKDIELEEIIAGNDHRMDSATFRLKTLAQEKRYIEIKGSANGPHSLMYFDGQVWKSIKNSVAAESGTLAWWNVSRLNGRYTLLLKSGANIATCDVMIGTLVQKEVQGEVYSAYKRAQLSFPTNAFQDEKGQALDQLVTITPVTMKEIYVQNRPILMTHGPIVEIKPSPWKFKTPAEGEDLRPSLKFYYTLQDLKNLGINPNPADPSQNLGLNIYQITGAGDLQAISATEQKIEKDDENNLYYVFSGPLDHFSTYTILKGKFKLSAPIIFADAYMTNKSAVTIFGTAEPETQLEVFVGVQEELSKEAQVVEKGKANGKGDFRLENIKLLQEGDNFIFVQSFNEDSPQVKTQGRVKVVKDTVPPVAKASANLNSFSPNNDNRYDFVEYLLESNEKGRLGFSLANPQGKKLIDSEFLIEADEKIKIVWTTDKFDIYKRDPKLHEWHLVNTLALAEKCRDGEYSYALFAIDEAGNISNNVIGQTILDTTPPHLMELSASPNPFTPNNDKVDDEAKFSFRFSEPAKINLSIVDEKDLLFKTYEGLTNKYVYPSDFNSALDIRNSSFGSWSWDGRGMQHNELLGGAYKYYMNFEDNVGNIGTSEIKSIFVDVEPSLVPYLYANPDPFSAFNTPTKIKYSLSRDNLTVNLKVLGEDNQTVKILVSKEKQNKGSYEIIWTGDCDPSYKGPRHSQDKSKITDGTYEFVIEVEDKEGVKPANISNTVRVDSTAPHLLLKPIEIDYVNKKIKFNYTVPEKASVEIKAYKEDNSLIQDFGVQEKEPGTYVFAWEPGTLASSPCYVHIIATDKAQNKAEAKTEIFSTVPQNIFKLSGFTALPSIFTPNGDGYLDQTKISYKIEGGVTPYKVSIDILSASGASIKKVIDHEDQSPGSQSFYWTGLLDPGPLTLVPGIFVSDGEYYVEIKAEDALGKKLEEKVKIIAVSTKPEIKISIDPVAFSPNADGSQDIGKVSYSINYAATYIGKEAKAKFEVYDKDNKVVITKYFNHTPGNYSFDLDGRDDNGQLLFDGEYVLRAFIEDALGSPGLVQSSSFKIDNVKPSLSILSFSPREFSPNGDSRKDNLAVSYSLSKKSKITACVLDQQNQVVHTLIDNQWIEKYEPIKSNVIASKVKQSFSALSVPEIRWDGTALIPRSLDPLKPSPVPDGTYKLRIFATDEAGNSSYLLESILIDTQFPIAPQISNLPAHTNIQAQFVQGTGEAQALAYLYNNEILIAEKTVEASGSFSFPVNLLAGDNSFKVKVEDAAGNISAYSNVVNAFYETTAPQITSFEVSPKIAKAGNVLITFEASEPLAKDPTVKVNTNSALLQSSNGNQYTYIYAVSSSDKQGTADISIELEDLAGNLELVRRSYLGEGGTFSIDTQNIVISEVDISPYYASAESEVAVSFSVNEKLFKLPELSINNNKLSFSSSQEISNTKYQYEYKYKIQPSDKDNAQTLLKISVEDLAHNITLESYAFVVDKTVPQVLDLNVEKDPAKAGDMKISFKVSESLNQAPVVKVKQNGDIVKVLPVAGDYTSTPLGVTANNLSAIYNVVSGFDGTAQITVEVIDKALNANIGEKTFVVDTIKPEFTDLKCEIELNQDFSRYAKLNSKVKITFKSSEALKFNPDVEINGNLAVFTSFLRTQESSREIVEYVYEYTITSQDKAGVAQLKISGSDLADNFGENTFDLEKDTFVIDLISPIVEIENNSVLIANPSRFSTNANPIGGDPRLTNLYYKTSEYGKVTLSIHKIPNDKITYERSDFNANNKIAVLVNGVWLDGGSHSTAFDGKIIFNQSIFDTNNDNFADPGKYAFIVEVKDRAGNVTERLWGGTFWIQDNVLKVDEPDQAIIGKINPNPKYFSPKGLGQTSKFHFKILLGITPKQYKDPERIEVLGVQDDIAWITGEAKKAGTYTVRIYDVSNNLIRTIVENKEFYTATNYYEEWDGFSLAPGSLGPLIPVPDGKYYFEIEVKDYSGNPALVNNKMRKEVYVDNTVPEIINPYSGGIDEWKNASRANDLYNVDFKDFGSKLVKAEYKIEKQTDWREIFNVSANPLDKYETDWKIDFNACKEGVNNISIRVYDQAGNTTEAKNAFYIQKDTGVPGIDDNQTGDDSWRTLNNGVYNIDFSDTTSDISYFQVKVCKNDKQQNQIIDWTTVKDRVGKLSYTDNWLIPDSIWNLMPEGTSYVSIKVFDSANNSVEATDIFYVKKDTIDPEVIDNQAGDDNWKSSSGTTYDIDFRDSISGLVSAQYRITTAPNQGGQELKTWTNIFSLATPVNNYTQNWGVDFDACPEGTSYVSVKAFDHAGRSTIKNDVFYVKKDITPPKVDISSLSSKSFNPYNNNQMIKCEFTISDSESGISIKKAQIYNGSSLIRDLTINKLDEEKYSAVWDGLNNAGDYVYEGNYTLKIEAIDNANSSSIKTKEIIFADDQAISNATNAALYPSIAISGENIFVVWEVNDNGIFFNNSKNGGLSWVGEKMLNNNKFIYNMDLVADMNNVYTFGWSPGSPVIFQKSSDYGSNWSKQQTPWVTNVSNGRHPKIAVEGNSIHCVFYMIDHSGSIVDYYYVKSIDDGVTWQALDTFRITNGYLEYNIAISGNNVHVVWGTNSEIFYRKSIDNGVTWSANTKISSGYRPMIKAYGNNIHIVWRGLDAKVFYRRSIDNGNNWQSDIEIDAQGSNPKIAVDGQNIHIAYGRNGYSYRRSDDNGNNWSPIVKLTNSTANNSWNSFVIAAKGKEAYVVWADDRNGGTFYDSEIYFQKIPYNYAPIKGTVSAAAVKVGRIEGAAVSTSLEAISPVNGENVKTPRPTFKWYGLTGVQKYKIECTKPGLFQRDLTKTFSSSEVSSAKPALSYTIHEFDEGLQKSNNDLDFWNWKIKAYDASDVVTAESTSNTFLIIPDLTLEEVINYPNPFNPKREMTKIRYRLSRDAEWVKIRIYDLVGSLVRELDGTTNAEGVNIFQKYNDVTWDGLNGRGDMVLNGVYPFEVTAKLGDRIVSGRGKIAVLK